MVRKMSENHIAEELVKPSLNELGIDDEFISPYGTYSIRFGTRIFYADYVVSFDQTGSPYLVVEVKSSKEGFDIPQVQSYALMLRSPFFALTDGENWKWFLTGNKMEKYTEIDRIPLPRNIQNVSRGEQDEIFAEIEKLIEHFDTQKSHWVSDEIEHHNRILDELETALKKSKFLSQKEMIGFLTHPGLMNDPRNTGLVQAEVLYESDKVKKALTHLIDDTQPLEKIYDDLVRSDSQYKIRGLGPMSITRLLASINHNCFTIDTDVLNQLVRMGICSQRSRRLTGREYSEIVKFFNPLMSIKMFKELGMELLHVILRNWDELKENN